MGLGACNEDKKCLLHDTWKEPKEREAYINKALAKALKSFPPKN